MISTKEVFHMQCSGTALGGRRIAWAHFGSDFEMDCRRRNGGGEGELSKLGGEVEWCFCSRYCYWRHLGIYAYRGAFLKRLGKEKPCALETTECLEQLRALYLGGRIAVIQTEELGVGVDTPEDVAVVEAIIRKQTL